MSMVDTSDYRESRRRSYVIPESGKFIAFASVDREDAFYAAALYQEMGLGPQTVVVDEPDLGLNRFRR